MRNFEWLVPVIVFSVFVVGNILRILNWKNEMDKKAAARRPRLSQPPPRTVEVLEEPSARPVLQEMPQSVSPRTVVPPARPLGQIDASRTAPRPRPQVPVTPDDLQRAIRRNRAKVQKRSTARVAEIPVVVPVVEVVAPRNLRDENPPQAVVPAPTGNLTQPQGAGSLIADLFNSPDAVSKAMVLQVIFSPPLSKRRG